MNGGSSPFLHTVDFAGIGNVELVVGNVCQMVAQFLLHLAVSQALLGEDSHNLDNASGIFLPLGRILDSEAFLNHLLYIAPVRGHLQMWTVGVVIHDELA